MLVKVNSWAAIQGRKHWGLGHWYIYFFDFTVDFKICKIKCGLKTMCLRKKKNLVIHNLSNFNKNTKSEHLKIWAKTLSIFNFKCFYLKAKRYKTHQNVQSVSMCKTKASPLTSTEKVTGEKYPNTLRKWFSKSTQALHREGCQLTNVNSHAGCHAGLSEAPSPCHKCPR